MKVAIIKKITDDIEKYVDPFYCFNEDYFEFIPLSDEELERYEKDYKILTPAMKKEYRNLDSFFENYHCMERKNNKWGRTYNPNEKWDTYEILYRIELNGAFLLSKINHSSKEELSKIWDAAMSKLEYDEGKAAYSIFKSKEYYIQRYASKEFFIECSQLFYTDAVITPEIAWHDIKSDALPEDESSGSAERDWAISYFEKYISPYFGQDFEFVVVEMEF